MIRGALTLLAGLLLLGAGTGAQARTRTYLVVIAENHSLDADVPALEYADDDAAKNWELFSLYADRAALFVVLDGDTARLHPDAARQAEVPDRAAVLARLADFDREMAADRARGDQPVLFILYAGHGGIDDGGQGYITLHDARLTRAELYRDIIAPSHASFVHVVVDACKSYYLVEARGKPWRDDSVAPAGDGGRGSVANLLAEEELEHYPRAGVIVATSGAQDTHEWSRYRGGILSHELRSALAGAADVNGDGLIEYSEVRAFLGAANARVTNPEVRLDTFARPPALDRHRALVDQSRLPAGRGRRLHFGASMSGAFSIEYERGVRLADMNKDGGTSFDVVVPAGRAYFVRRADGAEVELGRAGGARVDLAGLSWRPQRIAARGAVERSFRRDLYRIPFGRRFYEGFVATSGDLPVDDTGVDLDVDLGAVTRRQRFDVGYLLSAAPAGAAGASHALLLGWGLRLGAFDVGAGAELGYGRGQAAPERQALTRLALLITAARQLRPGRRLGVELLGAAGWQLLSGTVDIDGRRLTGSEPRGLRAELAAGLSYQVTPALAVELRGGAAVDGVYSASAGATGLHPFAMTGLGLRR